MSPISASMKRIESRTAEKKRQNRFPIISLWRFFQALRDSLLCSWWSDLAEFRTLPSTHACHRYLQVLQGSDEKQLRKSGNTVFIFITLCVAMETRGLIWPNLELNKALMYVTNICKYEKDRIKNS